ncbi:barstar family protein [Nocardia macrotermitis]|uniref:barstar family protein n=1 Tax=Nocardia macrotermitis TaxID=2585198 RepID=UPI0038733AEB
MIDANSIGSSVDFFCALGESINGPGGYFGDNLDSLSDCLCGGFGASVPFTINVRHGKKLTDRLPPQFLSDLIEVMSHAKVTLNLEYK